jgi:hypothetical protein
MTVIALDAAPVYFHASANVYDPGQTIAVQGESSYAIRARARGHGWVNEFLDRHPGATGKPARVTSSYCCEHAGCCGAFAVSDDHLRAGFYVYEVRTIGRVHVGPMVLVGRMLNFEADAARLGAIASEYWNPTQDWKYLEVLADSLQVVRRVASPEIHVVAAGQKRYADDVQLAQGLGW